MPVVKFPKAAAIGAAALIALVSPALAGVVSQFAKLNFLTAAARYSAPKGAHK